MGFWGKLWNIMRRNGAVLAVFLVLVGMLVFVEARPQFPDPDSFYHVKMAQIIRDQGFIHAFPWLQYTVLAESYVDYHLGYHLLLVPFVTFFSPLVGMKVAAGVFSLIAFYTLYRVLKWFQVPRPEVFTALAILSTTFFHRMSLPRAPSLSVALLLIVTGAMIKKKPRLVFAGTFAYVWFYYGWPLLFAVLLAVVVGDAVASKLTHEKGTPIGKMVVAMLGGVVAGLTVNPYFPQNIFDTARDVFKIAIVNYHTVISVGTEWYPTTFGDFAVGALFGLCAFVASLVCFVVSAKRQQHTPERRQIAAAFTWFLLFGGFFVLTIKSARFVEYAVPTMVMAAGTLFVFSETFIKKELLPELRSWFRDVPYKKLLGSLLGVSLALFLFKELTQVLPAPDHFTATQFQPSTDWIRSHVPADELIFHNAWDFSLALFYLDDTHRYLVGLDPTYMYDAYPEDYQLWFDLVSGTDADVGKIITHFQSHVVVIDTRLENDFEKNLQSSGLFDEVITDGTVHLYVAK